MHELDRSGRQQDPQRRRRRAAADPDRTAGRQLLHQQAAQRIGPGGHLHSQSRPYPARRPAGACSTTSTRSQLGGHAVDLLLEGHVNGVAILQHDHDRGFYVSGINANDFRDRWGVIHARRVHPSFYDPERLALSRVGVDYLLPIFSNALGTDDMEYVRQNLFRRSNLTEPYHSVNVDINKRICYLD